MAGVDLAFEEAVEGLHLHRAVGHQMHMFAGLIDGAETDRAAEGVGQLVEGAILASELDKPAGDGNVVENFGFLQDLLLIELTKFTDCHDALLWGISTPSLCLPFMCGNGIIPAGPPMPSGCG